MHTIWVATTGRRTSLGAEGDPFLASRYTMRGGGGGGEGRGGMSHFRAKSSIPMGKY